MLRHRFNMSSSDIDAVADARVTAGSKNPARSSKIDHPA
jgi:hypothetical protein